MIFESTDISEVIHIVPERFSDDRGSFARVYCSDEFRDQGISHTIVQMNHSKTIKSGCVRGIHHQIGEFAESKLVQCVSGAIFDVAVDLRPNSQSYLQWVGRRLDSEQSNKLYIPEGFGHAYMALTNDAEVIYSSSARYAPEAERGVRPDDPAVGINWPEPVVDLSQKDASWPLISSTER